MSESCIPLSFEEMFPAAPSIDEERRIRFIFGLSWEELRLKCAFDCADGAD